MEDKSSILKVKNYFRKLIACPPVSWRAHRSLLARRSFGGLIAQDGFTLIETIMVMVIIAILAVAIVVRNPFDAIKLSSATRKVAGDIRYVQKLAISNQTRAGIVFTATTYSVYANATPPLVPANLARSPGDPCSTDSSNNFIVDFNDSRCSNYQNVQITSLPSDNPIAFNSLGTPVDGNGNVIGQQSLTITYNGTQEIRVEAGTGRVSIP